MISNSVWKGWTHVRVVAISDEIDTWMWKNVDSDDWAVEDDFSTGSLYLVFRRTSDVVAFKLTFGV